MPRRPAMVTQADIARAVRAMQAAGYRAVRVVLRPDGVLIESDQGQRQPNALNDEAMADPERIVIL